VGGSPAITFARPQAFDVIRDGRFTSKRSVGSMTGMSERHPAHIEGQLFTAGCCTAHNVIWMRHPAHIARGQIPKKFPFPNTRGQIPNNSRSLTLAARSALIRGQIPNNSRPPASPSLTLAARSPSPARESDSQVGASLEAPRRIFY
jgi:hypothetical protein